MENLTATRGKRLEIEVREGPREEENSCGVELAAEIPCLLEGKILLRRRFDLSFRDALLIFGLPPPHPGIILVQGAS